MGLLLPCITFSQKKIVNRIPSLCLTLAGERCVFPFKYNGKEYHKCTSDNSPTPWCSTLVDNNGTTVTNRWGDCDTDTCPVEDDKLVCTTVGGPSPNLPCIFPFKHNGVTYNSCTTATLGKSWCSTETYTDGRHKQGQGKYGLCSSTCPGAQGVTGQCVPGTTWYRDCNTCSCNSIGQTTCKPTPSCKITSCTPGYTWRQDCNTCTCSSTGKPLCTNNNCGGSNTTSRPGSTTCDVVEGPAKGSKCVFPFKWGGKTYSECAAWTYGGISQALGKTWCSTKTTLDGQHVNGEGNYGFCSSTCPLKSDYDFINPRININTDDEDDTKSEKDVVVLRTNDDDNNILFGEQSSNIPPE